MTATTKREASIAPAQGRTTTPQRKTPAKVVRVWGEVSVTLPVSDSPPSFIKVTFGHERMCADNDEAITRMERAIYKQNEGVVERRVRTLTRLINRVGAE